MTTPKKASDQDRVAVEFKKRWNRYFPSDVAGFDKKTADELIKAKIAVKK